MLHQERQAADPAQRRTGLPLLETFAPDETNTFKAAEHVLQITAGAPTCEAARAPTLHLWSLANAARELDGPAFAEQVAAGLPMRKDLYAAMRSELAGEL